MAGAEDSSCLLLALPDTCLLAVLQRCAANDQRSVLSAARAHSRLHQAAVLVLHSITAVVTHQEQVDSMLLYLGNHGQHVRSVSLKKTGEQQVKIRQLPPGLQLENLQISNLHLRLHPGNGCRGVLGAAADVAALKQLQLDSCAFITTSGWDGSTMVPSEVLAAALQQLPAGLQHLSLSTPVMVHQHLATGVLQRLLQLTHLELCSFTLQGPGHEADALQPLKLLTGLMDLRLSLMSGNVVAADVLSGMQHLTRLELCSSRIEPGILAGKTRLQHLNISGGHDSITGAAGVAQLLGHLQPLQQLTQLVFTSSLPAVEGNTSAAAYSALTASSKLQHLTISFCKLPTGAWQHIFPAGRQLPHLRSLDISFNKPSAEIGVAPDGSRLVSCCPGLQFLNLMSVRCGSELLAPLQRLSGLTALLTSPFGSADEGCLGLVCQLTGLKDLGVVGLSSTTSKEGLLLQLTQLKQLTSLTCHHPHMKPPECRLRCQAPGGEPVWRQLLQRYLDSSDPDVAQQAAAALAE